MLLIAPMTLLFFFRGSGDSNANVKYVMVIGSIHRVASILGSIFRTASIDGSIHRTVNIDSEL